MCKISRVDNHVCENFVHRAPRKVRQGFYMAIIMGLEIIEFVTLLSYNFILKIKCSLFLLLPRFHKVPHSYIRTYNGKSRIITL